MKLSKFSLLTMFTVITIAGCSSGTNVPLPSYPQVNYAQGQQYTYYALVLSSANGSPVAGSGDTITSTVKATNITYPAGSSFSNVTEIQNAHTHPASGATLDTTYLYQNSGNYWHYNYGIEELNGNPSVLNTVNSGKPINAGWVLQAKLNANAGDTWVAVYDTLALTVGTVILTDTVMEASDTTILVDTSHITAKHSVHAVTLKDPGVTSVTLKADTYVSVADGTVIDIDHNTSLLGNPAPGLQKVLIGTK